MYTVFKTNRDKVIFLGDYLPGQIDKLIKSQYGYLARRELLIKRTNALIEIHNSHPRLKNSVRNFIKS